MSSTSLFFDIFGRDQGVGKTFDEIGNKGKTMGSALKGIGTAMGAGLVGLGAAVLHTGLGELTDWSAGVKQLEAGIKSTNGAAHTTVDGMEALASSIQDYSGQTDDSIVSAENLLLTFTNIKNQGPNKIFDETTKAAADMAAKLGTDAAPQAMLLGKALNDPARGLTALTRAGVSFTSGQKASIKAMQDSGNIMGAQKIILAEVTKEFGGAAKAAGNSLPGQMAKSKRAFEDTSQSLTQALLPALTAGAKALTGFAKWIGQNKGLAAGLAVAVGILALTFMVLGAGITAATWPILAIGAGIALLIAGFIFAYNKLGWFKDGVNAMMAFVVAVFQNVISFISTVMVPIWTACFNNVAGMVKWLWNDVISPTFKLIKSIIQGVVDFFTGTVVPGFKGAANGISDAITGAIDGFNKFKDGVSNAIGRAVDFVTGLPGKITGALSDAGNWLVSTGEDIINGLVSGIENVIGSVGDTIKNGISGAINGVKNFLGIHSPSTVFAEIGANIGAGLAQGVEGTHAATAKTIHGMVDAGTGGLHMTSSVTAASVSRQLGGAGTHGTGGTFSPAVHVYIGNEEFNGHIKVIADKSAGKAIDAANQDLGRRPSR